MDNQTNNRIFIIGVVYNWDGKNRKYIEAVNLYDRNLKKGYLQSINQVAQRYVNGEPIVGIRIKSTLTFRDKVQDYMLETYPVLLKTYDYRKMSIVDGSGKIIKQGTDVIIGMREIGGKEKCVVVNNNYEERLIDQNIAIKDKLIGVRNKSFYKPSKELIN